MRDLGGIADTAAHPLRASSECATIPYLFPRDLLSASAASGLVSCGQQDSIENCPSVRWWLVYTKSRQEKKLSRQLTEMRVPHYLPVHKREAFTRGRPRLVEEPLFAGYLFLFADDEQRRTALSTNRISATHRVNDARRLSFELSQIAASIASGARLTVEANLQPGDWVRVKSGIHEGLEGVVLRRQNHTRLLLSVNFLKQGASLEVHDSLLEPIDQPGFDGASSVEIVRRTAL